MSQLAHLTQKEALLLKFIIENGVDKDARIQFDLRKASEALGLEAEEICESLRQISRKGFVTIHRIPAPKEIIQRVLEELEDLEIQFVAGAIRKEDYRRKRKKVLEELAAAGHKPPLMSLDELQNLETSTRKLLNRLDKMERMKEDRSSSPELIAKVRNEYNAKLSESNKLFSEFRPIFWDRLSQLARELQEVETVVQEAHLRMELGEYDEETYEKKLGEIGSRQDKLKRKIAILLGARAEAWIQAVPEELLEELDVLDARKEIGEITGEIYDKLKGEILQKIEESLLKGDVAKSDILNVINQYTKALTSQENLIERLAARQVITKEAADAAFKGTQSDFASASKLSELMKKTSKT